jgi:hypothetical protein
MQKNKKLGVIVPYRNRAEHLHTFKVRIKRYLNSLDIPYEIIIVNQDDGKLFNRGLLLNIGFKEALKLKCDYVVFHDVDMIPVHVDYSYTDIPVHLATELVDRKTREVSDNVFDEYFGGVTMFPIDIFKEIDGYSNKYWGWGYEDSDLLYRCKKNNIQLDELKIKNLNRTGTKLRFNGNNAYVRGKNFNNLINLNSNLTIFISFYPDEISLDHTKEMDESTIFCINGYNTTINYNSFMRYNVCTFDKNYNPLFFNSKIKTNYKTNICLTFDSTTKQIQMYQDGVLLNTINYTDELYDYSLEQFFYIGCSTKDSKDLNNFFKGDFDQFAVFSKKLNSDEILEISKREGVVLTQNGGQYKSSKYLKLYYDTNFIKEYKLIDLSGNDNDGEISNCEIVDVEYDEYKTISIPYRRESTFMTLKHDNNGFENNKWRHSETRWNQLRFHNEITKNDDLIKNDGLSTLVYVAHGRDYKDNILHINVGL